MNDLRERLASLTRREKEVFKLVITGKLGKEIAAELGISERTVKQHRSVILRKMAARSAVDLANIAHRLSQ